MQCWSSSRFTGTTASKPKAKSGLTVDTLKFMEPPLDGRVYLNKAPLPGRMEQPPSWPLHYSQFRHGLVLNWHIKCVFSVVHDIPLIPTLIKDECDLLCLCAIGRKYRPNYIKETQILKPTYVMPCHWDLFFTPLRAALSSAGGRCCGYAQGLKKKVFRVFCPTGEQIEFVQVSSNFQVCSTR